MAEPTPQTFSDEAVPVKKPEGPLNLDERVEKVLGYKPKTLESRRKIEAKAAREQTRSVGVANLSDTQDALTNLVTVYGPELNLQTPQEMETYLRSEALKEGPLPQILNTPEASRFFSNVARAEFAYEPRADTPIYSLDAYREGFKRNEKEQQETAGLMQQAYQEGAAPNVNYVSEYGGDVLEIPRWYEEDSSQREVVDKLNSNLSGGALGNMFGVAFTPEDSALQQRAYDVTPTDLKAMGEEDYAKDLYKARDLTISSDSKFEGKKFRPDQVYLHLMDVSGKGKNAINLQNYRREFRIAFKDLAAHEAGFPSFAEWAASKQLTDDMRERVHAEADEKAVSSIKKIQQQSRPGTIFIDDPDKLVRAVRKGEDPLAYTSPYVIPAWAFNELGLISDELYDEALRQRGPWAAMWYPPSMRQFNMGTLTYAEQVEDINPGTFQQIMNIGPLRVFGSWALSDNPELVYGSQDHLREMLQFDWGQNLGTVGEKIAKTPYVKNTPFEKLVSAGGTAFATGAMFMEADAITLALLPIGFAGKATKLGAKAAAKARTGAETFTDAATVYKLRRYDKLLDEVEKKVADGSFTDSTQVQTFFKENNAPELASIYDLELMSDVASSIRIGTTQKRNYSSRFDGLTEDLGRTRNSIKELEASLTDNIAEYIDRYGVTPPNASDDAIQLLKKKQEESLLEAGQAHASFAAEQEKLSQLAEQRGVGLGDLSKRLDSHSPDFFDKELLSTVEESRIAFNNFKQLLNEFDNQQDYYLKLRSFKKLTKKQKADFKNLEKLLPQLRKQIREAQELVRDRWADGALSAQYEKYRVAKQAYETKVVESSKYFKRDITTAEGVPIEIASKLRDNYAKREAARLKATKDLKNARRNLARATTDKTKSKWRKIIDEIEEGAEVKALDNQFQVSLNRYLEAEKGAPSFSKIGRDAFKKLNEEIRLSVQEKKTDYMQRALGSIRDSVKAYENVLQTNRIKEAPPLISEAKFVRGVDPDDPTRVLFNRDSYVDELVRRYTDDLDPSIKDAVKDQIETSKIVRDIKKLRANSKGNITLDAQQLNQLSNYEKTLSARQVAQREAVTSVAEGLIRSWAQPPTLKKVFSQIDKTDPISWLEGGLRTGLRIARTVRRTFDPQAHRFGDFSDNALNSARIAITKQGRANEELTLLSDQWVRQGENYTENVSRYLTTRTPFFIEFRGQRAATDEGLGVGAPAIMNQGERTPWQNFKSYILGLDKPEEALALRAVSYAYLGRGVEARAEFNTFSSKILGIAIEELKRLDDQSDLLTDAQQLAQFVAKIKKETKKFAGLDPDANRTFAFVAKGILHGAVMNGFLNDLVRSGGIAMTTKQALSANTILGQVKSTVVYDAARGREVAEVVSSAPGAKSGFSPAEGFKALEQYGLSMNDTSFNTILRNIKRLEDMSTDLISTNRLADPAKTSFVPQAFITRIEAEAGKISKQLAAIEAPDSFIRRALDSVQVYLRAWRTNILFGTIVPRAAYFPNQFMGDTSQLHTFEGTLSIREVQLGKHKGKVYATGAAPMMFQNAFTYVPYWGSWIQDYLITRTKDATRAGRRNVLTTPLQAALSPYVTKLLRMSDELMETKEGFRSGAQFMEEALEDGVLDTLMTDDLYRMLDDAAKQNRGTLGASVDKLLTGLDNYQKNWTNLVTTTQMRQRLALYAEYRLMRGESRSAAKTAVLDSLYDWRHGVTDWEMATLGQFIAFYPFFRLGAKQFQRSILEGLTNPSLDMAKRALTAQTKAARLRNQGRLNYSVANYVYNEDVDQALNEAEMQHEIYRRMRPWWTGSRPAPSNELMPKADQVEFRKAGRKETYYTTTFPMWTLLDMADLHLKFFNGLTGLMLYYGNNGQVRPSYDSAKVINKTLADFTHPLFKTASEGVLEFVFNESTSYRSPKGKRLRLGENGAYLAYSKVPFLGSAINITPDEKGYYVDNTTVGVIRGIPVLGTDLPNFWRDAGPVSLGGGNPKWASQSSAAMAFYLRNWTGIAKQIPFDPKEPIFRDRQQRVADFKKEAKKLRELRESRGAPEEAFINRLEFTDEEK
jgi:hypothetical protein